MPIANEIADLNNYFILILGAILLEKMLVTVTGYLAFRWIIPVALLLGVLFCWKGRDIFLKLALKLLLFGLIVAFAIPFGVKISTLIETSYQATIDQAIETAEDNQEFIEDTREELSREDKNWFEQVGDFFSDLTSKIGRGVSDMVKKGEEMLSNFIEAIAVLVITSCVIPIAVIFLFVWAAKILLGFDIQALVQNGSEQSLYDELFGRKKADEPIEV